MSILKIITVKGKIIRKLALDEMIRVEKLTHLQTLRVNYKAAC